MKLTVCWTWASNPSFTNSVAIYTCHQKPNAHVYISFLSILFQIDLSNIRYLVLDEADRMLDMGFQPVIHKLCRDLHMPPKTDRQTLMFSATFPSEVQTMAAEYLNNYLFITVGRVGGANTDIKQEVYKVARAEKRDRLVSILNEQGR